jgi:putative endonuclease
MNLKTNTKKWRQSLGELGEQIAADYLAEHGYQVLERNYRAHRLGEIDVIAAQGSDIAFIEVKTRLLPGVQAFDHTGQMAVSALKQKKITRTAMHYLKLQPATRQNLRFDVMLVDYKLSRDQILTLLLKDDLVALRRYAVCEHIVAAFATFA